MENVTSPRIGATSISVALAQLESIQNRAKRALCQRWTVAMLLYKEAVLMSADAKHMSPGCGGLWGPMT